MIVISEEQLARLLQITPRYVRDVFEEFKVGEKDYNLLKSVSKYITQSRSDVGTYVNLKTLADILGVTERTVRNLTEKKVLNKNENDKYELKENIKSYLKSNSDVAKMNETKRKMIELRYEVFQDKYHEDAQVEYILSDMLLKFKARLNSCIRKIDNDIENYPERNRVEIISKHIFAALEELSSYDPPSNREELKKELE
ncbi:MAG: hypothetical protein Q4P79_03110 [Fusobacterium sp.]|nr:hypothetical protein [Fusobacterium sp.]MDO5788431.1 hypothetical protein [Fusobacterium sp.]